MKILYTKLLCTSYRISATRAKIFSGLQPTKQNYQFKITHHRRLISISIRNIFGEGLSKMQFCFVSIFNYSFYNLDSYILDSVWSNINVLILPTLMCVFVFYFCVWRVTHYLLVKMFRLSTLKEVSGRRLPIRSVYAGRSKVDISQYFLK